MSKRLTAVGWLVAIIVAGAPAHVSAQKHNQIRGQVVDRENRPVAGVSVKIKRGPEILDSQRTDKGGSYVLRFPPGSPISTVLYDCLDCYPCTIFNVSGSRDHTITKVIRKRGEALSPDEHAEVKATLTYLANNSEILPSERARYEALGKTLPTPLSAPHVSPAPLVSVNAGTLLGELVGTLRTKDAREGDPVNLIVREPAAYYGATIYGHVVRVRQGKGKSSITLTFDGITTTDGVTHAFAGTIREVVQPEPGSTPEGVDPAAQSADRGRVKISVKRAAAGAMVGGLIGGAIAGGNGATLGAGIGVGARTTTVLAQEGGELELLNGTRFLIDHGKLSVSQRPKELAAADDATKEHNRAGAPRQGAANDTADVAAVLKKAREMYESGRDDEALAELRRAMVIDPHNAEAYLLTGRINLRRGEAGSAINYLKTAIFWNPKLIDAHLLLGRIFLERGDRQLAMLYARNAMQIDPNNQEAIALQRQLVTTVK